MKAKAVLSRHLLVVIALSWVLLDQFTKWGIAHLLPPDTYHFGARDIPEPIMLIPGFAYLVHVFNDGAAWSLFSGFPRLLGLLGFLALGLIYASRKSLELDRTATRVCFGFICGGIVGNMIDRLWLGYVVDFIDIHFGNWRYPAFNVADIGITCGIAAYFIVTLLPRKSPATEQAN